MKLLYFLTFLCCVSLCLSAGLLHREDYKKSENEIDTEDICSLPLKAGRCKAFFYKYGYDPSIKRCKQFIYGGCHRNANNFETLEECEEACSGA